MLYNVIEKYLDIIGGWDLRTVIKHGAVALPVAFSFYNRMYCRLELKTRVTDRNNGGSLSLLFYFITLCNVGQVCK